ncbi:MAG TPA: carotenoid oxygenase family protein [Planctomycetota bacterium]|nr:carotenoid oxygenase family protein [Planctomycetota bacterium]
MSASAAEQVPFHLRGNYAPVMDELVRFDLPVEGALPPELDGLYVRNGSNPKSGASPHWFFGDGMLHGVRLSGGRAQWYRNRWVRTTKLERDADPLDPATIMDRTASAANTHVVAHAGRIYALEEGHFPYRVGPELETLGCESFGGKLTSAFTAHPKLCPETRELHFFGYGAVAPWLVYHVLDAQGELVHSAEIEVPGPTMMHDFMITRQHAIFMDLPVVFDLQAALAGGAPLRWDASYGARIGILPRFGTSADVRWFEVEPCYVFHPLNAWAEGDRVVCDVGRHESMWRTSMNDFPPSYLHRWTFDLATGAVREEQLEEVSHGFPRVDDRVVGLRHRYGWVVEPRRRGADFFEGPGVVARYDLASGEKRVHDFGDAAQPGEFVFAEAGPRASEDEGYALGFVYDRTRDTSELVVLDASAPEAKPLARVSLPRRVPHGFHGSWIRAHELGA